MLRDFIICCESNGSLFCSLETRETSGDSPSSVSVCSSNLNTGRDVVNFRINRRSFLKTFSATLSSLGLQAVGQKAVPSLPPDTTPHTMAHAGWVEEINTKFRKNLVGIQVRPFAWIDEGIDQVLDNLQSKAAVTSVFAYTFDSDPNRAKKSGGRLPDHGKYGPDTLRTGGASFDYDRRYFEGTRIKDFRSYDDGKFNVIADVAPKLKARGMDYIAVDFTNPFPMMMRTIPDLIDLAEVDMYGRPTNRPCYNHPEYQAYLVGKMQVYLKQYGDAVDGVMWNVESMGPIDNMIGADWAMIGVTCFCEFCRAKARDRGISVERAKEGFRRLEHLFRPGPKRAQRPPDGYFVTFWRTLMKYPEVLAWHNLYMDSFNHVRAQLYGTAKALAPEKPYGLHMMQNITFSPFYSASEDIEAISHISDFLKIATYSNAGGPRMGRLIDRLADTVFRDAESSDLLPLYSKMMNYDITSVEDITLNGLSSEYLSSEAQRMIADVEGRTKIYPSIDIDVPTAATGEKRTHPEDVKRAVAAAWSTGVPGIVLARDYSEMWLANLSAAGEATRTALQGRT